MNAETNLERIRQLAEAREDERCTVYDARPEDCRDYPHLHKEFFTSRLMGVIDSYAVCPIVFKVYEHLKDEIWRGRRRR